MAVSVRGGSPATAVSDATASVPLTGTRQPQAGDRLLIIHANDSGTLAAMATPTVAGSTSGVTVIAGSANGGTNKGHAQAYYYDVPAAGDRTVAVAGTDTTTALVVYVLSGHAATAPVAAGASSAWNETQTAPSVTAGAAGLLLCHTNGSYGDNAASYTPPAGMAEAYDVNNGNGFSMAGATLALAAAGATGTKAFAASQGHEHITLTVAVPQSGAGGGGGTLALDVTPASVGAGQTVTATATGPTPTGWQITGPAPVPTLNGTGMVRTFTAPARATDGVYTVTAQHSSGNASDTVTVRAYGGRRVLLPGGWRPATRRSIQP